MLQMRTKIIESVVFVLPTIVCRNKQKNKDTDEVKAKIGIGARSLNELRIDFLKLIDNNIVQRHKEPSELYSLIHN